MLPATSWSLFFHRSVQYLLWVPEHALPANKHTHPHPLYCACRNNVTLLCTSTYLQDADTWEDAHCPHADSLYTPTEPTTPPPLCPSPLPAGTT